MNKLEFCKLGGGASGRTASYETSSYGRKDLHRRVRYFLSQGFSAAQIGDYIRTDQTQLTEIVRAATGTTIQLARLYYTGERMFELMDDGIFDLEELASYFRAMDAHDVFVALASEGFPMGNEYLKGWLTAKYLKVSGEFDKRDLFVKYLLDKEIIISTKGSIFYQFRKRELLYEHYQREDFIPLLRFYASIIIKDYDTIYGFINHLGLHWENHRELEALVYDLFGFDFDTAKDIYSDHYFGRLQILIS